MIATTALRVAVCAALIAAFASDVRMASPRFFPDDPIWADDDALLDASGVAEHEDPGAYDFAVNSFTTQGERRDVRALNVNTVDEVPDSSWFSNRLGRTPMGVADVVRGPDRLKAVSLDGWIVSGGKSSGLQPGFRMTDPAGQLYQIEFDPPSNPEMATGAEMIGTAFYHAMGYHVVEVYLAELDPATLVISDKATIFEPLRAERRRFTRRDIDNVLHRAARLPNGNYRVLVSRFAAGRPLGNFRYHGTRPDDPNDIIAHEHRRELRAARVFGAWLNHDDSRGLNSLDMLASEKGRRFVKHYMFDFGSILGSGTIFAQRHRAGNEYILDWKPGWLTLFTAGLYLRPWMLIDYPDAPASVGRFEADAFDAERWKPEYPNPAFANMRADDAFWAARLVSRFTEPMVRGIVEKARYSDPRATDYLVGAIMKRRDKVLKTWLTPVNPIVDVALSATGELTFANAATDAGVATAPSAYLVRWARFDNVTDEANPLGTATSAAPRVLVPAARIDDPGAPEFLQVEISAVHPDHATWNTPLTAHFRRGGSSWSLVGMSRLP